MRTKILTPLLLLGLAAPAHASTLEYTGDGDLVFTGGAGATSVDLNVAEDGRLQIEPGLGDDPEAVPAGCEWAEVGAPAYCELPSRLVVVLGDGDDRADVRVPLGLPVAIDGGAGGDTLRGNIDGGDEQLAGGPDKDLLLGYGGSDTLDGGDGNDVVDGGAGADTVQGGAGADELAGDDDTDVASDVIDGGPGLDTLDFEYGTTSRPDRGLVAVTLDTGADDGFQGEGDDLRGLEIVKTSTGGTYAGTDAAEGLFVGGEPAVVAAGGGDDTVYTSYSNDVVNGGDGNDELRGYSGDDRIVGGPGADTIAGDTIGQTCNVLTCSVYSGNDVIDARDGERDSIDCGPGADQALVDPVDVAANCEDVRSTAGPGPSPRAARLTIATRSLQIALDRGLAVRVSGAKAGKLALTARRGRSTVGRCVVRVGADGAGRCTLRLSKSGRRALRGLRSVKLSVVGGGASRAVKLSG